MTHKFCSLLIQSDLQHCLVEMKDFFSRNDGVLIENNPESIENALKSTSVSFLKLLRSPKFHGENDATKFSIKEFNGWTLVAFSQPGLIPGLATALSKSLKTALFGCDYFQEADFFHFSNIKNGDTVSYVTSLENNIIGEKNMNYKGIIQKVAPSRLVGLKSIEEAQQLTLSLLPKIMPVNIVEASQSLLQEADQSSYPYLYLLGREERLKLQLGVGSDTWEHLVTVAQ